MPADCVLVEGTVLCDQAALTGESLPVQLHQGELVKMGTTIRRGDRQVVGIRHRWTVFSCSVTVVPMVQVRW